jgi:hypothetical protein
MLAELFADDLPDLARAICEAKVSQNAEKLKAETLTPRRTWQALIRD